MATKRNFKSTEEFVEFTQNLCEVIRSLSYKKETLDDEINYNVERAKKAYDSFEITDESFEEWWNHSEEWEASSTRNYVKNYKLQQKIYDEIINYLMEVK